MIGMRRFRFRLERVLAERRRLERRQQYELAVLNDTLVRARHRLESVHARIDALRETAGRRCGAPSCSVRELMLVRDDIDAHRRQAEDLDREIRWLEGAVARGSLELQEIARERLVLERVRERRYAEHLRDLRRAEAAAVDDLRRRQPADIWGE